MPSVIYPQCLCVLYDREIGLENIEKALSSFEIVGRNDEPALEWMYSGPNISLSYLPEDRGFIIIDVVNRPWPDEMGDPDHEAGLFTAWTLGQFGNLVYPGALRRAKEQSWTWEDAAGTADQHKSFVRIRSSYVRLTEEESFVPADYEPLAELEFMTDLALELLKGVGSLCYFDPNGEVLRDLVTLTQDVERMRVENLPPFEVWSNIRILKMDGDWMLMDTVGNQQYGLSDFEACFPEEKFDPEEVHDFLRQLTFYQLENDATISDGDTTDGPAGELWKVKAVEESLVIPPRKVLRWYPDGMQPPV
ncbi:MAG: DUF4261 domain-containing protein [Candidatus Obscuribacterales bacterium]|nr:DUF4261 domain-containing protein [Candidatus Obscuribacterales bacterium]